MVGLKDSVIVSDKMEGLNPPPVTDQKNSKLTLNVDSHVANAHIVTGLPQRKGVNPNICQLYTEIKYVKDVSCVAHLPSVKLVTNAQHAPHGVHSGGQRGQTHGPSEGYKDPPVPR